MYSLASMKSVRDNRALGGNRPNTTNEQTAGDCAKFRTTQH